MASQFDAVATKPIRETSLLESLVAAVEGGHPVSPRRPARSAYDTTMGSRHPLRVLIVEDSIVNQRVLRRMVSRLGYDAEVTGDGAEALSKLERKEFDLVLMDIMMPRMDGLEATRRIRERFAEDRRPHIVAVTAYATQGDRERFLLAGMDDYICKPVRVEDLVRVLGIAPVRLTAPGAREAPSGTTQPRAVPSASDASPPEGMASARVATFRAAGTPTAGTAPTPSVPDRDRALRERLQAMVAEDDPEFVAELVGAFRREANAMIEEMERAVASGDWGGLARAAHTLKSSSADIGAPTLAELCAVLERSGEAGGAEDVPAMVARVTAELALVTRALDVAGRSIR